MNDPISDLLTRMRNASMSKHRFFDLPKSKLRLSVLKVLEQQGFIEKFITDDEKRMVRVFLRFSATREPAIHKLKRVSSPGLRRYIGCEDIPRIFGGMGIAILSTPKGVIDGETARKLRVGGELLCLIW
jgi:small subunit ribosomal protein S8